MSIQTLQSSGGIVVHDTALAAAAGFTAHVNQSVELGNEVQARPQAGSVYEDNVMITSRSPVVGFSTSQIKTLLDLTGPIGRCIKSDPTHPGVDCYLVDHDECSARDLTDSTQYRIAQGYLTPQQLTAAHQELANMSGQVLASTKEGNEPLIESEGVTYPSASMIDNESYTLYRCRVAGTTLTGLKNLQVDFGVDTTVESADGSVFPEWISVGSVVTRITLTGNNPRWLGAAAGRFARNGTPFTHANTTLQLIRCVETQAGEHRSIGDSVHITLTGAGLAVINSPGSTSDARQPATSSLMLYLVHDGTNAPLLINTAATLTDFT